jgi:hypothetical protein
LPLNSGGPQNAWTGNASISGVLQPVINSKLIQQAAVTATSQVTAGSLSAMSTASAPTTGEGLEVLSLAFSPRNTGSMLTLRAWGSFKLTTGTVAVIAVFAGGTTAVAAATKQVVAGDYYDFMIEVPLTAGTQFTSTTFSVYIGSTTGSDTVTAFGLFGGSIINGGISIEECLQSSG